MTGNPIAEEKGDDLKKEILIMRNEYMMPMVKINKEEVT